MILHNLAVIDLLYVEVTKVHNFAITKNVTQ